MKLAVLISPFATATEDEMRKLRKAQFNLACAGVVAIFLPDTLRHVLDDDVPVDRAFALRGAEMLVTTIAAAGGEAHQVGTRITEGMQLELAAWSKATAWAVTVHE